jgi:hypothetical protein
MHGKYLYYTSTKWNSLNHFSISSAIAIVDLSYFLEKVLTIKSRRCLKVEGGRDRQQIIHYLQNYPALQLPNDTMFEL